MGDTMYSYYEQQEVLPTYGRLQTEADLDAHERHRRRLFTDKLQLPPRLFDGARLLEFGPDAGENSLVFARWGAACTLAEPHRKAHPVIRDYFDRFGLGAQLAALEEHDLEGFPDPRDDAARFDVVDAEGFIYTIQPTSLWIRKLARLLRPEGLAVLFYVEAYGSLLELTWKVVQARHRALTDLGAFESARTLYGAKWDSIPHKRSIESWTMDVLENPFVRLRYFLEPNDLSRQMHAAGFRLYSAWPVYDGGLDVHWFKRVPTPEEQLEHQRDYVVRSRLSHMFGRKHFLARLEEPDLDTVLLGLVADVDALVDRLDAARAAQADDRLLRVERLLRSDSVIARPEDTERSVATVQMLRRLLEVLAGESVDDLVAFCTADEAFIGSWGMPSHFAVYRRAAAG